MVFCSICAIFVKEVEVNKQAKLSPHFSLGEMTKTSYHPQDGNIPSRVHIENMINLCENWLEELRFSYNTLYCLEPGEDYETSKDVEPIIINSGFRSPDTNHLCGGATHSNHLTGCAADIIRIRRRRYAMPASCWTSPTGRSRTSMSSSSRSEVRPSGYTSP